MDEFICPICGVELSKKSESLRTRHVTSCLDNPLRNGSSAKKRKPRMKDASLQNIQTNNAVGLPDKNPLSEPISCPPHEAQMETQPALPDTNGILNVDDANGQIPPPRPRRSRDTHAALRRTQTLSLSAPVRMYSRYHTQSPVLIDSSQEPASPAPNGVANAISPRTPHVSARAVLVDDHIASTRLPRLPTLTQDRQRDVQTPPSRVHARASADSRRQTPAGTPRQRIAHSTNTPPSKNQSSHSAGISVCTHSGSDTDSDLFSSDGEGVHSDTAPSPPLAAAAAAADNTEDLQAAHGSPRSLVAVGDSVNAAGPPNLGQRSPRSTSAASPVPPPAMAATPLTRSVPITSGNDREKPATSIAASPALPLPSSRGHNPTAPTSATATAPTTPTAAAATVAGAVPAADPLRSVLDQIYLRRRVTASPTRDRVAVIMLPPAPDSPPEYANSAAGVASVFSRTRTITSSSLPLVPPTRALVPTIPRLRSVARPHVMLSEDGAMLADHGRATVAPLLPTAGASGAAVGHSSVGCSLAGNPTVTPAHAHARAAARREDLAPIADFAGGEPPPLVCEDAPPQVTTPHAVHAGALSLGSGDGDVDDVYAHPALLRKSTRAPASGAAKTRGRQKATTRAATAAAIPMSEDAHVGSSHLAGGKTAPTPPPCTARTLPAPASPAKLSPVVLDMRADANGAADPQLPLGAPVQPCVTSGDWSPARMYRQLAADAMDGSLVAVPRSTPVHSPTALLSPVHGPVQNTMRALDRHLQLAVSAPVVAQAADAIDAAVSSLPGAASADAAATDTAGSNIAREPARKRPRKAALATTTAVCDEDMGVQQSRVMARALATNADVLQCSTVSASARELELYLAGPLQRAVVAAVEGAGDASVPADSIAAQATILVRPQDDTSAALASTAEHCAQQVVVELAQAAQDTPHTPIDMLSVPSSSPSPGGAAVCPAVPRLLLSSLPAHILAANARALSAHLRTVHAHGLEQGAAMAALEQLVATRYRWYVHDVLTLFAADCEYHYVATTHALTRAGDAAFIARHALTHPPGGKVAAGARAVRGWLTGGGSGGGALTLEQRVTRLLAADGAEQRTADDPGGDSGTAPSSASTSARHAPHIAAHMHAPAACGAWEAVLGPIHADAHTDAHAPLSADVDPCPACAALARVAAARTQYGASDLALLDACVSVLQRRLRWSNAHAPGCSAISSTAAIAEGGSTGSNAVALVGDRDAAGYGYALDVEVGVVFPRKDTEASRKRKPSKAKHSPAELPPVPDASAAPAAPAKHGRPSGSTPASAPAASLSVEAVPMTDTATRSKRGRKRKTDTVSVPAATSPNDAPQLDFDLLRRSGAWAHVQQWAGARWGQLCARWPCLSHAVVEVCEAVRVFATTHAGNPAPGPMAASGSLEAAGSIHRTGEKQAVGGSHRTTPADPAQAAAMATRLHALCPPLLPQQDGVADTDATGYTIPLLPHTHATTHGSLPCCVGPHVTQALIHHGGDLPQPSAHTSTRALDTGYSPALSLAVPLTSPHVRLPLAPLIAEWLHQHPHVLRDHPHLQLPFPDAPAHPQLLLRVAGSAVTGADPNGAVAGVSVPDKHTSSSLDTDATEAVPASPAVCPAVLSAALQSSLSMHDVPAPPVAISLARAVALPPVGAIAGLGAAEARTRILALRNDISVLNALADRLQAHLRALERQTDAGVASRAMADKDPSPQSTPAVDMDAVALAEEADACWGGFDCPMPSIAPRAPRSLYRRKHTHATAAVADAPQENESGPAPASHAPSAETTSTAHIAPLPPMAAARDIAHGAGLEASLGREVGLHRNFTQWSDDTRDSPYGHRSPPQPTVPRCTEGQAEVMAMDEHKENAESKESVELLAGADFAAWLDACDGDTSTSADKTGNAGAADDVDVEAGPRCAATPPQHPPLMDNTDLHGTGALRQQSWNTVAVGSDVVDLASDEEQATDAGGSRVPTRKREHSASEHEDQDIDVNLTADLPRDAHSGGGAGRVAARHAAMNVSAMYEGEDDAERKDNADTSDPLDAFDCGAEDALVDLCGEEWCAPHEGGDASCGATVLLSDDRAHSPELAATHGDTHGAPAHSAVVSGDAAGALWMDDFVTTPGTPSQQLPRAHSALITVGPTVARHDDPTHTAFTNPVSHTSQQLARRQSTAPAHEVTVRASTSSSCSSAASALLPASTSACFTYPDRLPSPERARVREGVRSLPTDTVHALLSDMGLQADTLPLARSLLYRVFQLRHDYWCWRDDNFVPCVPSPSSPRALSPCASALAHDTHTPEPHPGSPVALPAGTSAPQSVISLSDDDDSDDGPPADASYRVRQGTASSDGSAKEDAVGGSANGAHALRTTASDELSSFLSMLSDATPANTHPHPSAEHAPSARMPDAIDITAPHAQAEDYPAHQPLVRPAPPAHTTAQTLQSRDAAHAAPALPRITSSAAHECAGLGLRRVLSRVDQPMQRAANSHPRALPLAVLALAHPRIPHLHSCVHCALANWFRLPAQRALLAGVLLHRTMAFEDIYQLVNARTVTAPLHSEPHTRTCSSLQPVDAGAAVRKAVQVHATATKAHSRSATGKLQRLPDKARGKARRRRNRVWDNSSSEDDDGANTIDLVEISDDMSGSDVAARLRFGNDGGDDEDEEEEDADGAVREWPWTQDLHKDARACSDSDAHAWGAAHSPGAAPLPVPASVFSMLPAVAYQPRRAFERSAMLVWAAIDAARVADQALCTLAASRLRTHAYEGCEAIGDSDARSAAPVTESLAARLKRKAAQSGDESHKRRRVRDTEAACVEPAHISTSAPAEAGPIDTAERALEASLLAAYHAASSTYVDGRALQWLLNSSQRIAAAVGKLIKHTGVRAQVLAVVQGNTREGAKDKALLYDTLGVFSGAAAASANDSLDAAAGGDAYTLPSAVVKALARHATALDKCLIALTRGSHVNRKALDAFLTREGVAYHCAAQREEE